MTDDVLDFLLSDFQERPLPELVPRDLHIPAVPRKAVTLIGMRRSGKTYALYDLMRRLLHSGVAKRRFFYLNLEDERLGDPSIETLGRALELFYRRNPEARTGSSYLFFDEIQAVPGWERFLRRVIDTEEAQVYATGSSAKLLSTEVATSFRGRGLAVEVLPFGLREATRAHGVDMGSQWPPGAPTRSRLEALADEYLERGGFPEVQHLHGFDRVQVLQDYVELVLLKDVAERHGVANLPALRHLVRGLFAANAGAFSVSRLHGTLVSQGVKVGKPTLLSYLDHLSDAYLVFLIPIRSRSAKQRIVNPRKVYSVDTGLAAAMRAAGARDVGALLENFVYLELRRRLGRLAERALSYYRSASGREVDFAVDPVLPGGALELIQVCMSLQQADTREREVRALTEAMAEAGIRQATVVTLADRENVQTQAGVIRVVPAWEWALEPAGS
ncbi:MAG: ATP-binding protein [Deferrisomatales bacterium]|nr:ATP-binding protein [Deferrisomatales bacterium]